MTNYIYIDHQNVGEIDLSPLADPSACLILALGPKTDKLSARFLKQLLKFSRVHFLKSVVEGHNAVDLLIAHDIGIQVAHRPNASFHIISKDKDFDSLVQNLQTSNISATRHETLDHFPSPSQPATPSSLPAAPPPPRKSLPAKTVKPHEQIAAALAKNLADHPKNRPATRARLRSYIKDYSKPKKILDPEIDQIIAALENEGHLTIDPKGKVTYLNTPISQK